jgi:cathepsin K
MKSTTASLLVLIPVLLAFAGYSTFGQTDTLSAVPLHVASLHTNWMVSYDKVYANPEEQNHRLRLFHKSYELVSKHNADTTATYTMELNQFADMDNQEIRAKFLMGDMTEEDMNMIESEPRLSHLDADAPEPTVPLGGLRANKDEVDWRTYGYVPSTVLNQGSCGSCWAFSATSMAEVSYNVKKKVGWSQANQFSPQQVLDCSGAGSCSGGWPYKTASTFYNTGGVSNRQYPYKAVQGACDRSKLYNTMKTNSKRGSVAKNESSFETYNAYRVLSVVISVNQNFMMYKGGVFNDRNCRAT